jgi:hypothetical protein
LTSSAWRRALLIDLGAVADDAGVRHQAGGVPRTESRHDRRVEIAKRGAEVLALAEDRQPAQARHEAFEDQLLEQAPVLYHGPAPLAVVIAPVKVIRVPPPAPGNAICPDADAGRSCDR